MQGLTSCPVCGKTIDRLFLPLGAFSEVGWSGQQHCRMVFPAGRDLLHDLNLLV
jgi:hypothetical protein